jgi:hypothetical protein
MMQPVMFYRSQWVAFILLVQPLTSSILGEFAVELLLNFGKFHMSKWSASFRPINRWCALPCQELHHPYVGAYFDGIS